MRKVLWFTLGFGAACGFCAYGKLPIFLVLPVSVFLAALFTGDKRKQKLLLSTFGLFCGLLWFHRFETETLEPVYALDGMTQRTTIRCCTFPEETNSGVRLEGRIAVAGREYKVLCYLNPETDPVPGDLIQGSFRFRVTAPGGKADSAYYRGEGILLLVYQRDKIAVTAGEKNWRDRAEVLRLGILRILDETLPADGVMFSKALLLGDSSDLDYATKSDLTVSGIRHIVAVSGLHVSILFSLVYHFSFRRRFFSALLLFPILLIFAAMTGFTPSVSRACIMSCLMLLATLVNREYDGPVSLSVAGLLLLLINPLVITSVGFQLSFASVAGIFLFSTRIRDWLSARLPEKMPSRVGRYLSSSVSVTLGATVLTVPLSALHFGTVSLAALITNLLVLWVVSFIFYGLILLCLLHSFWTAGALMVGKILTILIRYVLVVARIIADCPLSAVYIRSVYITAWLIFVYLLLACYLVKRKRNPVNLICYILLGLYMALLVSWIEPMRDNTRLTVLDVGQGQCLLVESEGYTFLVDCGGSSDAMAADAAAETLLSHGVPRLDCLIVTHADRDHAGGVSGLLSRVDASYLILPPLLQEENYPVEEILYVEEALTASVGNIKIRFFPSHIPGNDNESSLCILFDTENCDILVTGDRSWFGEKSLLKQYAIPEVDVLIAGHHGSDQSTSEYLLQAVCPEIVCISAGKDNVYGHPNPELLERLESFGCTVYRTDLQGDIIIRR